MERAKRQLDIVVPAEAARWSRKGLARLLDLSPETSRLYVANERLPSLPVAIAWARQDPAFRAQLLHLLAEVADGFDE